MNNKILEEKYKKILQEIKNEKLDWDFHDFLQQSASQQAASSYQPKNIRFLNVFWIAASLALLFCLSLGLKMLLSKNEPNQNKTAKAEKQINNDSLAWLTINSLPQKSNSEKQQRANNSETSKPKKQTQPKSAQNKKTAHKKNLQVENNYKPDFVIVNGKKIENEKEAIDITKEAFQIIALNMKQTIHETKVINKLDINF